MATVTSAAEPQGPSQLTLLHRISNIVSSELSIDEMLEELIGLTVQVTACDACLVYLIDKNTNEIVLRASKVPHKEDLGVLRLKMGEGITGWVAEHKSPVALSQNASADHRFKRFQILEEDTYDAFLSVPLVTGGEVIGVVNIHHRDSHNHTAEETALVAFIGEQMGVALSRALLTEVNNELLEEREEMKRQLEIRKLVERAKGILQRRYELTEEEAYLRLRNESRRLRRPMKELAEAIILAEDLSRKQTSDN